MYAEIKNREYMTGTFKRWLTENLDSIYGEKRKIRPVQKSIEYTLIDDSDKPGLIEIVKFELNNGDKFEAHYWHNDSYKKFERAGS